MSTKSSKAALYETFATVAKALAHAHRLELLEQVAQGERSIETLANASGLSVANASQHLLHLRRAGLIASRRDGQRILYRLSDDKILKLLTILRDISESSLADTRQIISAYYSARDSLEPISSAELIQRIREKSVIVLDVRPEDEFEMGHIPSAINIPLTSLAERLEELPRSHEIVAYCRAPYCMLSYEAAALLRSNGLSVRRLEYGYPEWRAARHALEVQE